MIEMKRITKLGSSDCLAILFSSDSETIKVKIEDSDWITINSCEVCMFEGLQEGSCYHVTAKTESEELRLAFSTQYNLPKQLPYTYYHASGSDIHGK